MEILQYCLCNGHRSRRSIFYHSRCLLLPRSHQQQGHSLGQNCKQIILSIIDCLFLSMTDYIIFRRFSLIWWPQFFALSLPEFWFMTWLNSLEVIMDITGTQLRPILEMMGGLIESPLFW